MHQAHSWSIRTITTLPTTQTITNLVLVHCNNKHNYYLISSCHPRVSAVVKLYATRSDVDVDDNDDSNSSVVNYEYYQLKNNPYDFNRKQNKQWLKERFKFSKQMLEERSSSNWKFLTKDNSILEGRADWLQERLGFNDKEMVKIVQGQPIILSRKTNTSLRPTLDCLEKIFGKNPLKKMALKQPTVLFAREEDIDNKLLYLQDRLKLDRQQVTKIVMKFPRILASSLEENIEPKIEWLQQRLVLTDEQLGRIVLKQPQIISSRTKSSMERNLSWLQERLSVTDKRLYRIIALQPSLLGMSIPNNLEPTLQFYVESIATKDEDVIGLLSTRPTFLERSLENRLKPRLADAKEAGILIDLSCLRQIAMRTDEEWDLWLSKQNTSLN